MKATFSHYLSEGGLLIDQDDADPYELPPAGSTYLRGDAAWTVSKIEPEADPPQIHLVLDRETTSKFLDGLPEGTSIHVGRNGHDGLWHADISNAQGTSIGFGASFRSDDPLAAVAEARAKALKH